MKVWRVENSEGKGCYFGENTPIKKYLCSRHNNRMESNPAPQCDRGINRAMKNNEICAFSSKEQALDWFSLEELEKIKEEDFKLKEIEVAVITEKGQKQVLCIR